MKLRGEESYKEVIQKIKWGVISDVRAENQEEILCEEERFLSRWLVLASQRMTKFPHGTKSKGGLFKHGKASIMATVTI